MIGSEAIAKVRRGALGLGRLVSAGPRKLKLALRDWQDERDRLLARTTFSGPSIAERQDALVRFYGVFEALVETLCDASQYGPTPKLQEAYSQARLTMQKSYGEVRPYVSAYLDLDPRDAQAGLGFYEPSTDAFQALYAAPTLAEFLRTDDGNVIQRIERTRRALTLYGHHLRQLVKPA